MAACKQITFSAIEEHGMRRDRMRLAGLLAGSAFLLSGCYVMQTSTDPNGNPQYVYSTAPIVSAKSRPGMTVVTPSGPAPAALNVRLYPANDLANQTGVLTGQVTNMMSGKGQFQFNYQGESLIGEATRVSNDERRGIASAYGSRGTFARCDYQMSTPYKGAGTCTFSNGASYQLHIGS
ncbi:MAG: hypothetical protein ACO3IW_09825 [Burkholderiales bacterium]